MDRLTYRKITGERALRIWQAVYRNRAFTDHGTQWSWAEIVTDARNVYFRSPSGCLLTGTEVEIFIGL